jgi:hypothetical protein
MTKTIKSWALSRFQQTIFVFLVEFSVFLTVSRFRLVDGDEGFYLLTSRLVTEGKLPYRDFLLTQMPLLPYAYGWWMRFAGMTWLSARLLSAILTAALGTALCNEVSRQTGKWAAGVMATLLFLSSTLVFAWLTIVKTYALSTLLLFLAYSAVIRYLPGRSVTWLIAGALLGASVDVRLYFAGLLPVFLWWTYNSAKIGFRVSAFLYFLGGCALAMTPNLYLLGRDPQAYFFDNLGFHAVRSNQGLIGDLSNKMATISGLFLAAREGNGIQMTLLCFFILVIAIRRGIVTRAARLSLMIGLVLSFVSLLPTPTYVQYFCVTVPFFILFVACSMSKLVDILKDRRKKSHLLMACGSVLLVFVVSAIPDYRRFLSTGTQVADGPARAPNWRIPAISAVSRAIDEQIRPAERVMSLWPGYIFQSKAEPYAGLENNSATYFADDRLSPSEQVRYHILSPRSIQADIAAHRPRLVVIGNQESMMGVKPEPFEKVLASNGYKVVRKIGDSKLWLLK